MELHVSDLATKSDNLRYPYESNGVKVEAAPIKLERGGSYKGILHYTAEFIPGLALKNIEFETRVTEKDRVASNYENDRASINSSVSGDDGIPTYIPEHSTSQPNAHPIHETNNVPEADAADAELNDVADKKTETEVEMSREELLAQRE